MVSICKLNFLHAMQPSPESQAFIDSKIEQLEHKQEKLNLVVLQQTQQIARLRAQLHQLLQILKLEEVEQVSERKTDSPSPATQSSHSPPKVELRV